MLEDSATDAELISRMLSKEFPRSSITLATDKQHFLDVLNFSGPDVILADNSLPGFDAREALKIVRQRGHIPFIMVSGTMMEEYAVEVIRSGADDYILKDRLARLPAAIISAIRYRETEKEKSIAVQALRQSEENYRTIMDRISDGFLLVDRDWGVLYANPVFEKLFNRAPGSLQRKRMDEEFPEALGRPFYTGYLHALNTNEPVRVEDFSVVTGNWLMAIMYPSENGVAVFCRDMTGQRRAELEAQKTEKKFRTFIQRITDAFISLDRNWCYTYLNKQAGELIQQNPDDLIGRNVWEIFPEAVDSSTFRAFTKAMEEQRYISNVDYYAPLDLWQENHIYPDEQGISVFIRNITEKKKLEIALKEREKIEKQQMLAAVLDAQEKERNTIALELHDNVNQILAGTRVLLATLRHLPGAELVEECISNLGSAIQENRKIAHELVTPDMKTEDLVSQLTKLCEQMLNPSGVVTHIESQYYDPEKAGVKQLLALYRIAQEQCSNIVKYAKAKTVFFSLATVSDQILFRITDDGEGAQREKITSGIGLKNIQNRVSVFGGLLEIHTSPGKGFEVEINLPLQSVTDH